MTCPDCAGDGQRGYADTTCGRGGAGGQMITVGGCNRCRGTGVVRAHVNKAGAFQSDKYPTCPAGKVPLSVNDPTAQDLLWEYAQRRRAVDAEFSDDLEHCLREAGYVPADHSELRRFAAEWIDREDPTDGWLAADYLARAVLGLLGGKP